MKTFQKYDFYFLFNHFVFIFKTYVTVFFFWSMLIYKSNHPSIHPSVCPFIRNWIGETRIYRLIFELQVYFFLGRGGIRLLNEHLFPKYFIRQFLDQTTNDRDIIIFFYCWKFSWYFVYYWFQHSIFYYIFS